MSYRVAARRVYASRGTLLRLGHVETPRSCSRMLLHLRWLLSTSGPTFYFSFFLFVIPPFPRSLYHRQNRRSVFPFFASSLLSSFLYALPLLPRATLLSFSSCLSSRSLCFRSLPFALLLFSPRLLSPYLHRTETRLSCVSQTMTLVNVHDAHDIITKKRSRRVPRILINSIGMTNVDTVV